MSVFGTFLGLACTALAVILIPRLQARRTPFGINIPNSHVNNPHLAAINRGFSRAYALVSIPIVLAATALTIPGGAAWPSYVGYALLLVALVYYWRKAHKATHALVVESGWLRDRPSGITGRITGAPLNRVTIAKMTWLPYALATVTMLASTIILLSNWDSIPDTFPRHYNDEGNPDGFLTRGPNTFIAVYISFILTLFGASLSWVLKAGQLQVRQTKGSKDRARFDTLMRIQESTAAWMLGGLSITLSLLQVQLALPGILPLPAGDSHIWSALFFLIGTGGTLLMIVYSLIAGNRAAARTEPNLNDPDEYTVVDKSSHRKAGIFYHNPNDPAYFVEKAIGYGIDFNYAHWPAKVFFTILLVAIAALVWLVSLT